MGCLAPIGPRVEGSVTSMRSATSAAASRSARSTSIRASKALCAAVRASLTRRPASARSVLASVPSAWRANAIGDLSPRCSVFARAKASRSPAWSKASRAASTAVVNASCDNSDEPG